jgi:hypothetical protein
VEHGSALAKGTVRRRDEGVAQTTGTIRKSHFQQTAYPTFDFISKGIGHPDSLYIKMGDS